MSTTPNLLISHIAAAQNQKEVTANTAFDDLDEALCGNKTEAMSDANFTVPQSDFLTNMFFIFTGALSANRNVILPANAKPFIVKNNTTSSPPVTLTFKVGTGAAVVIISDSSPHLLYSDGVNSVYQAS